MYETFQDVDDLKNALCKLGFTSEMLRLTDQWRDHLRSCVQRAGGEHFKHMLWNEC